MSPLLTWSIHRCPTGVVVELDGELDASNTPALEATLRDLTEGQGNRRLSVDLAALRFIDSMGINLLLHTHRRLEESGGHLTVCRPRSGTRRILEILGVTSMLDITQSHEALLGG
jgi:stage II sporulation protein AA (anti-sigma F factor antagonist)